MCSGWSRHTEGRWQHRPGVDALGSNGGRDNAGEAQERRTRRLDQSERWRIEDGAKSMEDALGVIERHQAGRAREYPEGQCGDVQGRGGSSEVPASCYCVRLDADPRFERTVCRSRAS
jgi:hypothetical protein